MSPLNVSLADLIARLDEELPDASDLARISEAHLRAQTLSDLGDQLIGHYVGQAKQAGASWSEIGNAIGVSKQAAQQRHAPTAFERFTDLAHEVLLAKTGSGHPILNAIEQAMPPAGKKAPRGHIAFRPESKEAIEQARRASASLGHDWVGTEHLLLGLIRAEESRAAQILRNLGFTSEELHETVRTEIARRSTARDEQ